MNCGHEHLSKDGLIGQVNLKSKKVVCTKIRQEVIRACQKPTKNIFIFIQELL